MKTILFLYMFMQHLCGHLEFNSRCLKWKCKWFELIEQFFISVVLLMFDGQKVFYVDKKIGFICRLGEKYLNI